MVLDQGETDMAGKLTRRPSSLLPWLDRGPLAALRQEMGDTLERFFGNDEEPFFPPARTLPNLDMSETDAAIEVKLDLPGVKPEEVEVTVNEGVLSISGERKEERESKEGNGRKFHRVERRYGSFARSVWLPCAVDEKKIDARYHDGVLTVTLPKSEKARAQKIKVKS
jgi:HSP20 family protein